MNSGWGPLPRIACLLLFCVSTFSGSPGDSIHLPVVAVLPASGSHEGFPVCDADHDGQNELYFMDRHLDSLFAFEHQGGSRYEATALLDGGYVSARDAGDADSDGKADVVCVYNSGPHYAKITLESPDENSLPADTTEIAQYRAASVWNAYIADLDQDSAREVFFSGDDGVIIYECTGDNRYELVDTLENPYGGLGMCWGDADRDGRPEVFVGGYDRYVTVFEATADDVYEVTAVCTTQEYQPGRVGVGDDMDGDGRRELVVYGGRSVSREFLEVFECTGDDSYELVWRVDRPSYGYTRFCMGDVEGDGQQEFATYDGLNVCLFKCVGDDEYAEVWRSEECWTAIALRDVNGNGRDELIHNHDFGDSIRTVIREVPDSSAVTEPRGYRQRSRSAKPSVVCNAPVSLVGIPAGTEIEVVDASGRVVAEPKDGVWNPRGAPPGAYFVRVRTGNQAVVQKVLVLR